MLSQFFQGFAALEQWVPGSTKVLVLVTITAFLSVINGRVFKVERTTKDEKGNIISKTTDIIRYWGDFPFNKKDR